MHKFPLASSEPKELAIAFSLNGHPFSATVREDESLMNVLRDQAGLISPKNGCAPQGSCGCCTVIVGERAVSSCAVPAKNVIGKSGLTLEGLDPHERDILARAFTVAAGSAIIQSLAVTPTQMLNLSSHIYPFINAAAFIPLNNQFLWMNLSQPERLYIAGCGIPVLAIFVVITTYLQSKLMTPTSQPGDQGAQMSKMMNLSMPFLMGWLAYSFASGLALYFITSNLSTIGQYAVMGKLDWRNLLPSGKPASSK